MRKSLILSLLLCCFTIACQESSKQKNKPSKSETNANDSDQKTTSTVTEKETISENTAFFKIDEGAKYSACYNYQIKQAMNFFKDKNFKESLTFFKKAESIQPDIRAVDALNIATNYVRLADNDNAILYFRKALESGIKWRRLVKAKHLADFRTKDAWKELAQEGPEMTKTYITGLDTVLRKQLIDMSVKVRKIRRDMCPNPKKRKRRRCPAVAEADSIHAMTILTYTKEKGFPSVAKIGPDGLASYLEFMRKGLRKGIIDWKVVKPAFEKAIFTGDLDPSVYAQLEDMYRVVISKRPQLYGNHNHMGNKKTKAKSRFNPIINVENVDERRLSLGLPTLKEYALQAKIKPMPMGYVEMNEPEAFLGCE